MGNLIPTTFFSEDWRNRAPVQILDFRAEVTGRIREIHVWFERVLSNNNYLTVRRAGTFILNDFGDGPTNYLRPNAVTHSDAVLAMDVSVTRGDLIEMRRVSGSGNLRGPAEFLMITEEA